MVKKLLVLLPPLIFLSVILGVFSLWLLPTSTPTPTPAAPAAEFNPPTSTPPPPTPTLLPLGEELEPSPSVTTATEPIMRSTSLRSTSTPDIATTVAPTATPSLDPPPPASPPLEISTPSPAPTLTLTLRPGPTLSPTPTPSPRRAVAIIYVQSNLQRHRLGLLRPNGFPLLEDLHNYATAPAWSPNGRQIAFFGEQGISELGGIYQLGNGIWLVNAQGQEPRQLLAIDHVKNLSWSPDGTKLAFEVVPNEKDSQVWVIDAKGGDLVSAFIAQQPAWSPTSQRLAVKACLPGPICGLWSVSFDGGDWVPLTDDANDSYPTWSPDGNFLAFSGWRNEDWDIYLLRLDNKQLTNLTARPGTDTTPVFSPDWEIYLRTDYYGAGDHWWLTAITLDGQERTIREGIGKSDEWGLARPAVR